jgi:hypothetical protein
MPKVIILLLVSGVLISIPSRLAAQNPSRGRIDTLIDNSYSAQKELDPDRLTEKPIQQVAEGGCNINMALKAIIKGNSKEFIEALKMAKSNYELAANSLRSLPNRQKFQRALPANQSALLKYNSKLSDVKTLDDIIMKLEKTASASAGLLTRILSEKGSEVDLHELVQQSTDMTTYVGVFLALISSTR